MKQSVLAFLFAVLLLGGLFGTPSQAGDAALNGGGADARQEPAILAIINKLIATPPVNHQIVEGILGVNMASDRDDPNYYEVRNITLMDGTVINSLAFSEDSKNGSPHASLEISFSGVCLSIDDLVTLYDLDRTILYDNRWTWGHMYPWGEMYFTRQAGSKAPEQCQDAVLFQIPRYIPLTHL
jgi:hypothetical protein